MYILAQEVPSAYLLAPDLESLYPIELYDRLPVVPEVLTLWFYSLYRDNANGTR
jgi:hypothetical protein